jgi:transposase
MTGIDVRKHTGLHKRLQGASDVLKDAPVLSRSVRAQITVIMLLLARLVHWQPALAGLGATAVLVPLTAVITRKAAAVRKRLVERTDARVKLCTETVTGARRHVTAMGPLELCGLLDCYVF